jgi:hypothetical protein
MDQALLKICNFRQFLITMPIQTKMKIIHHLTKFHPSIQMLMIDKINSILVSYRQSRARTQIKEGKR